MLLILYASRLVSSSMPIGALTPLLFTALRTARINLFPPTLESRHGIGRLKLMPGQFAVRLRLPHVMAQQFHLQCGQNHKSLTIENRDLDTAILRAPVRRRVRRDRVIPTVSGNTKARRRKLGGDKVVAHRERTTLGQS